MYYDITQNFEKHPMVKITIQINRNFLKMKSYNSNCDR